MHRHDMPPELRDAHDAARDIVLDLLKASRTDKELHHAAQIAVLSACLDDLLTTRGGDAAAHVLRSVADGLEIPRQAVN